MIEKKDGTLTIGELSRRSSVPASTLRYYESVGLLAKTVRQGGKRRYNSDVLTRLLLIRLAKSAGFTIKEIRTLISGFDRKTSPGHRFRKLGKKKLAEIEEQIDELQSVKRVLQKVTECDCPSFDDCASAVEQYT